MAEKEGIKDLVERSTRMSAEKARMVYGFHNVHNREDLLYRSVNEEADFLKHTIL